jgi:SnoaL-like domain
LTHSLQTLSGCRIWLRSRRRSTADAMRVREMWREVITHVPDFHIELVEVVADGADIVVVGVNFLGMGWASGADISTTVYQAVSFRDGKVAIVQGFRTARGGVARRDARLAVAGMVGAGGQ